MSSKGFGNTVRALTAAVAVIVGVVALPSIASAGLAAGAGPTFPSVVALGQVDQPASITLSNQNTAPNTASANTICNFGDGAPCPPGDPGITLIPSCGQLGVFSVCAAGGADPGVLAVSPTGLGAGGTACAGMVFDIALIDPTFGQLRFTPQGGAHVVLAGTGATCQINFTFDAMKLPSIDQDTASPGLQTVQIVDNTQTFGSLTASARGTTNAMTISKASPTISTVASNAVSVGGTLTDSATVAGLFEPAEGSSVTFNLYGPDDATCSRAAVVTSDVALSADGRAASPPFVTTAAGVYRWVASYAGDANNNAVTGTCGDPTETVTVAKATPSISTVASTAVGVGGTVTDTATVTGLFQPATDAAVTFHLFGPADATCSGAPLFTSSVTLSAEGTATSQAFTTTTAGVHRWVASYPGDANNNAVTGTCGDPTETVTVAKATPTIATTASPPAAGTSALTDTAKITGLVNPVVGSSVTFNLYGPTDTTCDGLPVFVSTVPIAADGTATSAGYTPNIAGVYRWIAVFGGDANNNAVKGVCGDASETVTVTPAALPVPVPTLPATGGPQAPMTALAALSIVAGWALRRLARRPAMWSGSGRCP